MSDLKVWQKKIQEKRKQTDFRDFLMEIASFFPLVLHKHKDIVSSFPPNFLGKKIIHFEEFEKKRDSLLDTTNHYDIDISFFENYKRLFHGIDIFNLINYGGNENSDYANMVMNSHNCYLSFTVINSCENVLYSVSVKDNIVDTFNGLAVWDNSQSIYFCASVVSSFKIFYSKFIHNSNNIWFSTNLNGCSECLFCSNLENSSYYIHNQKYDKETYLEKKKEMLADKNSFLSHYQALDHVGKNIGSHEVKGSAFFNSQGVENAYIGYNVKNGRNLILVGGVDGNENMYDVFPGGAPHAHDFYGVMGANGSHIYCSQNIQMSSNIFYSYNCKDSSYLIGCIGLQNKSYCILNKQYEKEQWYELADKIFASMEAEGTLGDFFPGHLNPYYFNDTMAGLLGDFSKQEVEAKGYMWRDEEIKVDIPEGSKVVQTTELNNYQGYDNDGDWKINPEILGVVIQDEKGNYYRIVQMEYDFLMKHSLPLPEIHWMDRMKLNFGL